MEPPQPVHPKKLCRVKQEDQGLDLGTASTQQQACVGLPGHGDRILYTASLWSWHTVEHRVCCREWKEEHSSGKKSELCEVPLGLGHCAQSETPFADETNSLTNVTVRNLWKQSCKWMIRHLCKNTVLNPSTPPPSMPSCEFTKPRLISDHLWFARGAQILEVFNTVSLISYILIIDKSKGSRRLC